MKTAISIGTEIYHDAEEAAAVMGLSRSKLYTLALEEYLRNHRSDSITERLNRYYENRRETPDEGLQQAAYALFSREDW
jgi:hypothetical protein